jgi:hypothetical protein
LEVGEEEGKMHKSVKLVEKKEERMAVWRMKVETNVSGGWVFEGLEMLFLRGW